MSNIWFISDMHLFHKNILSFKNFDGTALRPEFTPNDPNDTDEVSRCLRDFHDTLLENTNKLVKDGDKLYNLGDVAFLTNPDPIRNWYSKINTRQHRLLFGNHDVPETMIRTGVFKKTGIWRVFRSEDFTASHIPIHSGSCKTTFNVHGHLHCPVVTNADDTPNLNYINVCVEHTNYHPVNLDDIVQMIRIRRSKMNENASED